MSSASTLLLSLALALGGRPVKASPCDDDARCEAKRLLEHARTSSSASHRVKLALAAHRLWLTSYESTTEQADLCAANSALQASLDGDEVPESLRQVALDTRAEFVARHDRRLESCEPPKPAAVPLLDPHGAGPLRLAEYEPEPEIDSPGPQVPSHRGMRIAGATLIGLGAGLLGAGSYGLAGMIAAKRDGYALVDDTGDGPASAEQLARDAELRAEYQQHSRLALGAGITGGVAIILGAALLGARRRHIARSHPSMAVLPTGGGLVLKGRF